MMLTTLCYIEHKGHCLLLHRNKKTDDINEGKWIGVGGKFHDGESPDECLLREVFEETGYELTDWRFRGIVTFVQEGHEAEYMCLFTSEGFLVPDANDRDSTEDSDDEILMIPVSEHPDFTAKDPQSWPVPPCDEGELAWIPKQKIPQLSLWDGDRVFLKLLESDAPFFSLRLDYSGDALMRVTLDGAVQPDPPAGL